MKVALAAFTTEMPRAPENRITLPSVVMVFSGPVCSGTPTRRPFCELPGRLQLDDVAQRATTLPPRGRLDAAVAVVVDAAVDDLDVPIGGHLDALVGGARDLRVIDDVASALRARAGFHLDRVALRRPADDAVFDAVALRAGAADRERVERRCPRSSFALPRSSSPRSTLSLPSDA